MAEEKNIKEQAPETVGAAEEAKAAEAMKAEGEAAQDSKERKKSRKEEKKDEQLAKQVEELTDKLAKEKDSYLRLMAEFETFRRRAAEHASGTGRLRARNGDARRLFRRGCKGRHFADIQ